MIKKIGITFGIAILFATASLAQRFAYVDVNKILENMDDYKNAQEELDKIAAKWRQDIAQEYDEIKGMYNRYQAEQVLLSDEQRKKREEEIMEKERAVREMQKEKFGPEGELFVRRKDLVEPIQNRVYSSIESYANESGLDFIFDKGSNTGILFSNPRYDKTEDIMRMLGIQN